jgi:hypothetical protein
MHQIVTLIVFKTCYNLCKALRALQNKNNNSKHLYFFLSPTPLYPFPSLVYFFHPFYLPSVFILYFSPFLSLPLSHLTTFIPHVLNCLSLSSPSTQYLFYFLYLDSLILSLLSCLSVSLSLSLSSTFIHLPFALHLSTSSLAYLFLW